MSRYTIATDAITTTVEAETADEAARKFASTEKFFQGCVTVQELSDRAEEEGGWATVEESV